MTKPSISGCVPIACSGLMITSLLQVVNRLAASCELHASLTPVVSSTCSKSANIKLQQVWCSQTWCNLMKSTGLIQLVGNLHQAGKIHNLHQVCGGFGFVYHTGVKTHIDKLFLVCKQVVANLFTSCSQSVRTACSYVVATSLEQAVNNL